MRDSELQQYERLARAAVTGKQNDRAPREAVLDAPFARRDLLGVVLREIDRHEVERLVVRLLVRRLRRAGGPVRRRLDEVVERLDRAAGGEPVGHVALLGQAGQVHDADARGLAGERARNDVGMIAARRVVVRQDDDIGADQVLGKLGAPFPGTACIAGRRDAVAGERRERPSRPRR